MSVPETVRHGSPQVIFEDYLEVGYNYRMTDVQAAVGRKQLERAAGAGGTPSGARLSLCRTARQYRRLAPACRASTGLAQIGKATACVCRTMSTRRR